MSGSELTRRAVAQAQRLGAELLVPLEVSGVSIDAGYKHLTLSDGRTIVTRTLLAATGMEYREHPPPAALAQQVQCVWQLHDDRPPCTVQTIYLDGRCELYQLGGGRSVAEVMAVLRRDPRVRRSRVQQAPVPRRRRSSPSL